MGYSVERLSWERHSHRGKTDGVTSRGILASLVQEDKYYPQPAKLFIQTPGAFNHRCSGLRDTIVHRIINRKRTGRCHGQFPGTALLLVQETVSSSPWRPLLIQYYPVAKQKYIVPYQEVARPRSGSNFISSSILGVDSGGNYRHNWKDSMSRPRRCGRCWARVVGGHYYSVQGIGIPRL